MPLNIATDVLDMASAVAGNLKQSIGVMGNLRTAALAGPIAVSDALRAHETLAAAVRWVDNIAATPGLGEAMTTRFGSAPGTLAADWAAVKDAARALLNGVYTVLPKAADGTVQIYGPPDPVTAERAPLMITLSAGQKASFTNLWQALLATIVL
jgi:hypothetical protein